jgi:putative Mn2+ efflux pump MntP
MERTTFRSLGRRLGIALYFVWILAVLALIVTQLTSVPKPDVLHWTVIFGGMILVGLGVIRIIYRLPAFGRRVQAYVSSGR